MIGLIILLIALFTWRKMEGKAPIQTNTKTLGSIVVGLIGIVVLLMLIPLTKGIHD